MVEAAAAAAVNSVGCSAAEKLQVTQESEPLPESERAPAVLWSAVSPWGPRGNIQGIPFERAQAFASRPHWEK